MGTSALATEGLDATRRVAAVVIRSRAFASVGRLREATAGLDQALALARELRDRRREGIVCGNLGILHLYQGRMQTARAHFDAVLAIDREVGDRRAEGIVLGDLANLHHASRPVRGGTSAVGAGALSIHRQIGDRRSEGIVLGNLGLSEP